MAACGPFHGNPEQLLEGYDGLIAEILPAVQLQLCLRTPRWDPPRRYLPGNRDTFERFAASDEFRTLRERHGLPEPARVDDFPVHAAIVDGRTSHLAACCASAAGRARGNAGPNDRPVVGDVVTPESCIRCSRCRRIRPLARSRLDARSSSSRRRGACSARPVFSRIVCDAVSSRFSGLFERLAAVSITDMPSARIIENATFRFATDPACPRAAGGETLRSSAPCSGTPRLSDHESRCDCSPPPGTHRG